MNNTNAKYVNFCRMLYIRMDSIGIMLVDFQKGGEISIPNIMCICVHSYIDNLNTTNEFLEGKLHDIFQEKKFDDC